MISASSGTVTVRDDKSKESPSNNSIFSGDTLIDVTGCRTLTKAEPVSVCEPFTTVAVIETVPFALPVTTPVRSLTVAMEGSSDDQVTV